MSMSKYYFDHSSSFIQLFGYKHNEVLYNKLYNKALHRFRRQLRYGGNPDILEERRLRLKEFGFKLRASYGKLEVFRKRRVKGEVVEEVF